MYERHHSKHRDIFHNFPPVLITLSHLSSNLQNHHQLHFHDPRPKDYMGELPRFCFKPSMFPIHNTTRTSLIHDKTREIRIRTCEKTVIFRYISFPVTNSRSEIPSLASLSLYVDILRSDSGFKRAPVRFDKRWSRIGAPIVSREKVGVFSAARRIL